MLKNLIVLVSLYSSFSYASMLNVRNNTSTDFYFTFLSCQRLSAHSINTIPVVSPITYFYTTSNCAGSALAKIVFNDYGIQSIETYSKDYAFSGSKDYLAINKAN